MEIDRGEPARVAQARTYPPGALSKPVVLSLRCGAWQLSGRDAKTAITMSTTREEAAPTFPTWKARLEGAEGARLQEEISRFLQILKTLGTPMIEGPEVNFIYYSPQARHVELTGEFNQWGRSGQAIEMTPLGRSDFFYHTMQLTEAARLEYKFIVDGAWQLDPFCPNQVDNGLGDSNSYFIVGDFHDPPELQRIDDIAHGHVEQFEFSSKRLDNTRRVYVYLPAAYVNDRTRRFDSLYVHDGGEYLERAKMANVLDNLIAKQQIPGLIAVMVDPVNRMEEYWANDRYLDFLGNELVPAIDGRYRTERNRKRRGVMGASLGGLISTYAALSRPELFSLVAGQSSALMIEEQRLATMVKNAGRSSFRFYFDVGKYEPRFIPAHERLIALIKQRRWPTLYQELPGGHNWTSWRAHLKDLLAFLWKPPQRPSRPTPASRPAQRRRK
jgi:enterochelin esterase-like enzyme